MTCLYSGLFQACEGAFSSCRNPRFPVGDKPSFIALCVETQLKLTICEGRFTCGSSAYCRALLDQ